MKKSISLLTCLALFLLVFSKWVSAVETPQMAEKREGWKAVQNLTPKEMGELVESCIQNMNDINQPSIHGLSPWVVFALHGRADLLLWFLNQGAQLEEIQSAKALVAAVTRGQSTFVNLLIEKTKVLETTKWFRGPRRRSSREDLRSGEEAYPILPAALIWAIEYKQEDSGAILLRKMSFEDFQFVDFYYARKDKMKELYQFVGESYIWAYQLDLVEKNSSFCEVCNKQDFFFSTFDFRRAH